MISIIVPTYKRNNKLIQCCKSLLANHAKQIEILILDQNNETSTDISTFVQSYPSIIRYIKTNTRNKSKALNQAILLAKGNIIAFTDDDCIVSSTWIKHIRTAFNTHSTISCVTGNTFPYGSIPPKSCPPTIKTKTKLFTKPQKHTIIGYGNNFAIRKPILLSMGAFKNWLGPGSIGSNCEDGEILLRLLTNKYSILHDALMILYHNKNINGQAYQQQQNSYVCGEMACYSYYAYKGWNFASRVIQNNFVYSYKEIKKLFGDIFKRKTLHLSRWRYTGTRIFFQFWGLIVGTYYFCRNK